MSSIREELHYAELEKRVFKMIDDLENLGSREGHDLASSILTQYEIAKEQHYNRIEILAQVNNKRYEQLVLRK